MKRICGGYLFKIKHIRLGKLETGWAHDNGQEKVAINRLLTQTVPSQYNRLWNRTVLSHHIEPIDKSRCSKGGGLRPKTVAVGLKSDSSGTFYINSSKLHWPTRRAWRNGKRRVGFVH